MWVTVIKRAVESDGWVSYYTSLSYTLASRFNLGWLWVMLYSLGSYRDVFSLALQFGVVLVLFPQERGS